MNIKLPSNGHFGLSYVEMRQPRIADLRKIQELSENEQLAKIQFVKMLMDKPEQLDKVSTFDKEYLFLLAVGVINLNKIAFSFNCTCGEYLNSEFDLTAQELIELSAKDQVVYSKELGGKVYNFKLPSVADELEIIEWATQEEDDFDTRYQDGLVMSILGLPISDEGAALIAELDIVVYFSAIFFYQCGFHGVETTVDVKCPNCGKETTVIVPITKALMSIDTMSIMSKFAAMSKTMDFASFSSLTLPELFALTQAMEAQDGG